MDLYILLFTFLVCVHLLKNQKCINTVVQIWYKYLFTNKYTNL